MRPRAINCARFDFGERYVAKYFCVGLTFSRGGEGEYPYGVMERRCYLDMAIRFLVCILTAVCMFPKIVLLRDSGKVVKVQFNDVLFYTALSIMIETCTCVFIIVYFHYRYQGSWLHFFRPLYQMARQCGMPFTRICLLSLCVCLCGSIVEFSRIFLPTPPSGTSWCLQE